jgi:hypothetical protein
MQGPAFCLFKSSHNIILTPIAGYLKRPIGHISFLERLLETLMMTVQVAAALWSRIVVLSWHRIYRKSYAILGEKVTC